MRVRDDRTEEQKQTHTWIVAGTDRILSGWGLAADGKSIAAWACLPENRHKVLAWVEARTDMSRVREVVGHYRPSGKGDCHIYVVDAEHPALN